eukprot:gene848-1146_t
MENKRVIQLKQFLADTPNDAFLNYALAIEYVGMGNDGKLYEREGRKDDAEAIYRKGITATMKKREQHAMAELQNALANLWIDDED